MGRRSLGFLVLAGLALGGCAGGVKPCMVIPAQIELARDVRDAAKGSLEEKRRDVDRWKVNIDQSRTRMARLSEERDRLRAEVGGSGTTTAPGTGGSK